MHYELLIVIPCLFVLLGCDKRKSVTALLVATQIIPSAILSRYWFSSKRLTSSSRLSPRFSIDALQSAANSPSG